MTNLKESAEAYEPKTTLNIADLELVSVDINVEKRKFNEGKQDEFEVNVIVVNKEEYRVPDSVLKQLKVMVEEKPDMENFKVKKEGEGMNTTYTVIPM